MWRGKEAGLHGKKHCEKAHARVLFTNGEYYWLESAGKRYVWKVYTGTDRIPVERKKSLS